MKKLLISTGGGDCPGLNAVIRAVVKSAKTAGGWQVWGSREAFNGIMADPPELIKLSPKKTAGIHVRGGTILKTTNRGNPLDFPVQQADGTWEMQDVTGKLMDRIKSLDFDAVINIGGDGSQRISQALYERGLNIIGVPKTIDNDLAATDLTFGFFTAAQIATDCFDKLVTTAESHHRVMIMEVMGRDAGWIALHAAIAGGAEMCLIPEIPFDLKKILKRINKRYVKGKGFMNIVVAEGAKPIGGEVIGQRSIEVGEKHFKLGGVAHYLRYQLEEQGCQQQIRTTTLGHIQRGGTPVAFDRILATAMGVKAFELVNEGQFGRMVSFRNNEIDSVSLVEATKGNKFVSPDHYLVRAARATGMSFGD
ncbi:MAG: ATP-dependent 6-phosphofructokinase [Saprospiraceae bacterium]|nr:MAG: ATP-dependent 6-phosphofructokinase [Saprospiraceae bacterium]